MSLSFVFLIIIFAAFCHAGWSTIVKKSENGLAMMGITSIIEIIIFLPLIFTVPFPTKSIWFFIFATTFLHGLYRYSVVKSYQYGDLSFVYPIARGLSPLLLVFVSVFWISEELSTKMMIAIGLITMGIFSLIFRGKIFFDHSFRAVFYALLTGSFIAAYTLADGLGVRFSGNAVSYVL